MDTSQLIVTCVGAAVLAYALRTFLANRSRLTKDQMMTLIDQGATIIDVRTPQEFAQGHAPGSRNIPLDRLAEHLAELDRDKPVLVCCASGARSGAAKAMLDQAGFAKVDNVGPWQRLLHA